MKKLLTIAGSDSSGGAGIQADLKAFAANNTYGMSVITALTAQNTQGVTGVLNVDREFVASQLDAVFTDIFPDAIKIGMVSEIDIIEAIREKLLEYRPEIVVLDPVMVATSGAKLIGDNVADSLVKDLFPLADIITPNMDEAGLLAGLDVSDKASMEEAARRIAVDYKGAILIKGGRLKDSRDDLLMLDGEYIWIRGKKLENPNVHGTGCTLSSTIAANLAKGYSMEEAVRKSKDYISGAIGENFNIGSGRGPLNHMYILNREQ